jgi:hypothetical protein
MIAPRARPVVTLAGALILGLGAGGCATLGGDVASRVAEPGSEETTSEGTGREVFAAGVDVGDCLRDPTTSLADGENEIERVRTVSCLEQHAEEVYASVTLIGIEFPGIEVIGVRASIGCIGRFEDFVGVPYAESILELSYLTPTEESWAVGDRVVLCTVYHSEGDRLTGSLDDAHDASYRLRDPSTGQVAEETTVDWLKIKPGDCVQEATDDFHETLVPCAEPHAEEVYAQFELSGGDEYPGDDEAEELANAGCEERFDEFVGQAYADSPLDYYYYSPIEESWLGGDRLVQCRIFDPEGDVTGSLRGTGIQST